MSQQIPDQQGGIVIVNVPNPAVGTDIVYAIPLRVRWAIRSVQATLTTAIGGVNRVPELLFMWAGIEMIRITASQLLAPAGTFIFGWHEGEAAQVVVGQTSRVASLPSRYLLRAGTGIQTLTTGLAPGDQWSLISVVAEEWIEP